jgi:group II intron reverse transcriptase/maturase
MEEQNAYRPGRSAHDAIQATHALLQEGYREVVDADLSAYFDTIPHHELMASIARRVCDGAVLKLIKQWLWMAVEEDDDHGGKRRTTEAKDSARGTPQGAPISPLLANIYMRRFIAAWKRQGWEHKFQAFIVNYADDFVILCRANAPEVRERMEIIMSKLKLKVNEQKTRVCSVPKESFDFLGYTIGRCYSARTGRSYIGTRPAKKRIERICEGISELTRNNTTWREAGEVVRDINAKLRGWANYFSLGQVSSAYRSVDAHVRHRVRQWLRRKHAKRGQGGRTFSHEHLYEVLGLVQLHKQTAHLPWAMAKDK